MFQFDSNRLRPCSTRRIRQIVRQYAVAAGIDLQRLSRHVEEKNLAIYRGLALADLFRRIRGDAIMLRR